MLQLPPVNRLPASSAAVARARLHVALRTDRNGVAAADVRRSTRTETVDPLLGRLLSDASYE
ncbi:MAG: hypothetical protein EI684_11240 [Candidatus Viridilinea halotolerans]|uniref:Uncharacterized protein n=1 Tax=Candidatus Viridilinea halotolerans TaxID=2491704 RepID=A0A426TZH5_9CHLR|nr:MAG: hypothetical protein EI684_11240 [Candidatus Viridilinea halotolerans]